MTVYKDIEGKSPILAYEIGTDYIDIIYKSGISYRYDYNTPGKSEVENMRNKARLGHGLQNYIEHRVNFRYAQKN